MENDNEQNPITPENNTSSPEASPNPVLGFTVPTDEVPVPTEAQPTSEPLPTNPEKLSGAVISPRKSGGKKKLIVGLLIVLVVGALGYLGYKYYSKHKPTTTVNATEKAVQDVALIRYGTGEGVLNNFAPNQDSDSTTVLINKQIYESLVDFRDKTKITPVLATSWTNPDSSTWVFTLKPNVKFHDGNTMKAKDIVYSYQQAKTNEAFSDQVTSTIKDVTAVDDTHVKITTNGVDPILLNRLSNMFIVDSTSAGKADPKYGTGPYMVKDGTTPDENHIDLVAFDGYHNGHVYTREVQVTVYLDEKDKPGSAETAMEADLNAGKLDIVGFVSADNAAKAKTAGLQLFPVDDNSIYYIIPNVNKKTSPLANLKIRQAIYQAIDIPTLAKAIGRDAVPEGQVVSQYIPGYNPAISRTKTDVAAAKQLVKDAGYPNGATFTLTVYSGAQDAGQEIVRQLKDIGITVKLNTISDINQLQAGVESGTFDAYYYADSSVYNDANDVFNRTLQSKYYTNSQIDTLMEQSNTTLDQTKRLNDLQQISKLAMDDVAVVPLYSNIPNWVTAKSYVMTQDFLSTDLGVLFYKVHLKQ